MSAPVGQIWVASIDNAQDFTLWVDGKKASEGESGDTTTDIRLKFPTEPTELHFL